MADQRTTITIEGDSKGAVDALDDVATALDEATDEVEELSEATEELSAASTRSRQSLENITTGASKLGKQASTSGQQLKSFGAALSALSPETGRAVTAISGLSDGVSGLVAAINPATIAVAALGTAVALGVKTWKDHQAALEASAEAMRRTEEETRRLQVATARLSQYQGSASQDLLSFIEGLDGASDAVRRLREEQAATARDAAYQAMRKEADEAAKTITSLVNRQLELVDQTEALAKTHGVASKEYRAAAASLERVRAVTDLARERNRELLGNVRELTDAYEEARNRGFRPVTQEIEGTTRAATAATPSLRELADAATRLAAAGDASKIRAMLLGGGEGAREMAAALSDASLEALTLLGVTGDVADAVRRINHEHRSTSDVLRSLQADVDAYAQAMRDAEGAAAGEAADVRAFDERLAAQEEWLARVSMGYEEQLRYEAELLDAAMLAAQTRQELNAEQMDALTEYYDTLRAEQAEAAESMREMTEALHSDVVLDGISSISSAVSSMASAFAEAAIGGEAMGEALGKAALKSIGQIAMQFGTLFMTTALGMAFMPGFQGNAAGLAAGGAALTLLGASLGAAAGKIGKGPSAPPESSQAATERGVDSTATTVVDMFNRTSAPVGRGARGARDFGESEDNADRYGINRGRAWA